MYKYFVIALVFMVFSSCKDELPQSLKVKPSALSKLNDVVVIADDDLWQSTVGDTFQYYFASAYPILPRPEPFFDLRHFSVFELNAEPLRRELRSYIVLVDLSDEESKTTQMFKRDIGEERFYKAKEDAKFDSSVGRDKWARGQLLVYLFGNSKKELHQIIKDNFSAVAKRIHIHDQETLRQKVYARKENQGLSNDIEAKYGLNIMVPSEYRVVELEEGGEDVLWLRKEIDEGGTMNLVFQSFDYTDQNQLSKEEVMKVRSEYAKRFVRSSTPGSYMQNNDIDLPIYDYTRDIDDMYTREFRGIWEMTDDFYGGAFGTFMIHNKHTNKLNFIDTWVFAPGENKRDLMQELELIVKSITFKKAS